MRTSSSLLFTLSASLVAVAACEDVRTDGPTAADDVDARACWLCGMNSANTNIVGAHDVSNVSSTFGAWASNGAGALRVDNAQIVHGGDLRWITRWGVTPEGELELFYPSGLGEQSDLGEVRVAGTDVVGARFAFTYDPVFGADFQGQLKVESAACEAGRFDTELTICRYVILTDVIPFDTKLYPENKIGTGWYHVCPNEDEDGRLDGDAKYSLVLSRSATLDMLASPPSVSLSSDQVLFGCLNGAVSKTQYYLNAFYDYKFAPHPRALAEEQLTPIMLAWMAWHGGESTTLPGRPVCFDDPIQGLFGGCELDTESQFEAAYGHGGASCANGDGPDGKGVHRRFAAPEDTIPGWDALPDCGGSDYHLTDEATRVVGVYTHPGVE